MPFVNGQGWNHFAANNKFKHILTIAGCREHLTDLAKLGSSIGIAQLLLLGRQASIFFPVPSLSLIPLSPFPSGSQVLEPGF